MLGIFREKIIIAFALYLFAFVSLSPFDLAPHYSYAAESPELLTLVS